MRPLALALLLWLGSTRANADPLRVTITAPQGGISDTGMTTELQANVSDASLQTAILSVNGAEYEVPVEGGRIEQNVVVVPGNNRLGVVVRRGAETARDSVTFHQRGATADLVIVLTWQSRGEIIDLWVREPSGETCKWDHRSTAHGSLLDFSASAIGFGSQAYVAERVAPGRYRIKVHYWGAYDEDDARSSGTYSELLDRLDALPAGRDAERRRIEAGLDAWAAPAAPQTPVRAEAILFPGQPRERRWRFDLIVHRTGELVGLGEVEITADAIRSARAPRP